MEDDRKGQTSGNKRNIEEAIAAGPAFGFGKNIVGLSES
jgi:hypothetical protein